MGVSSYCLDPRFSPSRKTHLLTQSQTLENIPRTVESLKQSQSFQLIRKPLLRISQSISGHVKLLECLHDWLDADKFLLASSDLPNVILSPLVVLSQLIQYSKYLKISHQGEVDSYGSHGQQKETVGFCIGLLSALNLSSAGNQAQFQQYGATAVRLAALIGALIVPTMSWANMRSRLLWPQLVLPIKTRQKCHE